MDYNCVRLILDCSKNSEMRRIFGETICTHAVSRNITKTRERDRVTAVARSNSVHCTATLSKFLHPASSSPGAIRSCPCSMRKVGLNTRSLLSHSYTHIGFKSRSKSHLSADWLTLTFTQVHVYSRRWKTL